LFTHKETGDNRTDGPHELKRRIEREIDKGRVGGTWNMEPESNWE